MPEVRERQDCFVRKTTVREITTCYNKGLQKSMSECTICQIFKQMGCSSKRAHQMRLLSAKNEKTEAKIQMGLSKMNKSGLPRHCLVRLVSNICTCGYFHFGMWHQSTPHSLDLGHLSSSVGIVVKRKLNMKAKPSIYSGADPGHTGETASLSWLGIFPWMTCRTEIWASLFRLMPL